MQHLKTYNSFINESKEDDELWDKIDKIPMEQKLKQLKAIGKTFPAGYAKQSPGAINMVYADAIEANKIKLNEAETSFEQNLKNAEVTLSFKTADDSVIEVRELEGAGMAGEDMTFAYIVKDDKIISKKEAEKLLNLSDFKELMDYLNSVGDANYSSAISFIK